MALMEIWWIERIIMQLAICLQNSSHADKCGPSILADARPREAGGVGEDLHHIPRVGDGGQPRLGHLCAISSGGECTVEWMNALADGCHCSQFELVHRMHIQ